MGDLTIRGVRPRTRRAVALGAVLAGLLLIGGGGTLVTAQAPEFRQSRVPLVGRTTTICTVAPPAEGDSSTTEVAAVATRQAPGREGQLTATTLGADEAQATDHRAGQGRDADRADQLGRGGRRGRDGHRRQRGDARQRDRRASTPG